VSLHRDADLFPYQRVGRDFLAARSRALLLDAPGVGKTVQACTAADALRLNRVAVVCPAIARSVWRRHFKEWAPHVGEVQIDSFEKWSRTKDGLYQNWYNTPGDALIVDEGHYLKTPTSARTKAVYGSLSRSVLDGLSHRFDRTWVLTGTLMPNHAGESWTHLRAHHGEPLSYNAFLDRYCYTRHTDFGLQVMGNKQAHLPELRAKIMRDGLRRRQEDVLPELPPIMFGEWPVDPVRALDKAMLRANNNYGQPLRDLLTAWAKGDFDDDEALFAIRESEMHLATLRRYLGMAKATTVAHAIADELRDDPDMAVILFAAHHDVIRELRECLADYNPACITGETPEKLRELEEMRFQSDPRCRVFIGQIRACQTAITLHRANHVVIVEPEWTPEFNLQAAKRAHRIGQTRPVFVRYASMPGTLDEAINRVLVRKTKMIAQVLD
jgi:SWI/SNF-related matrix-associated actin-dependent regulator 1 of chromatin subfamily A